jgi:hypothetical protein
MGRSRDGEANSDTGRFRVFDGKARVATIKKGTFGRKMLGASSLFSNLSKRKLGQLFGEIRTKGSELGQYRRTHEGAPGTGALPASEADGRRQRGRAN